jgi:hypothetical protein
MGLGSGNRDRVRDPGSGKNLFWITDPGPGVKKAPDPGSGSATLLLKQSEKIKKQARLSDTL